MWPTQFTHLNWKTLPFLSTTWSWATEIGNVMQLHEGIIVAMIASISTGKFLIMVKLIAIAPVLPENECMDLTHDELLIDASCFEREHELGRPRTMIKTIMHDAVSCLCSQYFSLEILHRKSTILRHHSFQSFR